jgi:hypothetical protein
MGKRQRKRAGAARKPTSRNASTQARSRTQGRSPEETARALTFLLVHARPLILERWHPSSCIASTRVALDFLRELGIRAYPMAVRVVIANKPMARRWQAGQFGRDQQEGLRWLAEDGSYSSGLGYAPEHYDPAREWAGHLVCVVDRPQCAVVLDISLDQASRPQHGVHLRPHVFITSRDWLAGETAHREEVDGSLLSYKVDLQNKRYLRWPDWTDKGRREPTLRALRQLWDAGAR